MAASLDPKDSSETRPYEPLQIADPTLLRQLAAMDGAPRATADLVQMAIQIQKRLNYALQEKTELEEI